MDGLGMRLEVELFDCDVTILNDPGRIEDIARRITRALGAQVRKLVTEHFDPPAISCVAIISLSDLAIHSWPECSFATVHVFSCVWDVPTEHIIQLLQALFGTQQVISRELVLGQGLRSPFFDRIEETGGKAPPSTLQ